MAKHLTMMMTLSPILTASFINMPQMPSRNFWCYSFLNHGVSQYSSMYMINWVTKMSAGLITSSNARTIGKEWKKTFGNTLQTTPSAKGKGKNADVLTAYERYIWLILWQNSYRSCHRPQCFHIRKLTHFNYHWPFDGMVRSFFHSWQKGGHYCLCVLYPHPHVSQIHTAWQWNVIQKPTNGLCSQATWH